MKRLGWICALAALVMLSACTTSDLALAPLSPLPLKVDGAQKIAQSGDILFEQRAAVFKSATLASPVAEAKKLGITDGESLYYVIMRDRPDEKAYCSMQTRSDVDFTGQETRWRTCLSDADGDSAFEQSWQMYEGTSGWLYAIGPKSRIVGADIRDPTPLSSPVRYVEQAPAEIQPVRLAVRYHRDMSRYVELVTIEEDGPQDAGFRKIFFSSQQFPYVVSIAGARIRVLGFTGEDQKALAYETLRGIPPNEPFGLLRLPTQTVYY